MIINQNLSALNTLNSLTKNTKATQASIQKLSTGQRINSASDDAAGLAISEKMRGQISGLKKASSNAQDGISMLQTAEGGLDQSHSILQRMRELAVQSSTDTNTADDRDKIQSEVNQLAKEITRISNTTEFNTQNLLAGGMSDTFHIGANSAQNISVSVSAMDAQSLGVAGHATTAVSVANTSKLNVTSVANGFAAATIRYNVTTASVQAAVVAATTQLSTANAFRNAAGASFNLTNVTNYTGTSDASYLVKIAGISTSGQSVTSVSYSKDNGTSWTTKTGSFTAATVNVDGMSFGFAGAGTGATSQYAIGDQYAFSVSASKVTLQLKDTGANQEIGSAVTVHVGDTSATVGDSQVGKTVNLQFNYKQLTTAAGAAGASIGFNLHQTNSSAALTSNGTILSQASTVAGIDVSTQSSANKAITVIDNAINTVSKQRSTLGAYENRLTNTIDNLNTSSENITASESRIRDVDMASEVSNYQKNNILQSAANSMLSKANQMPQSVLQLLQG